MGSGVLIFHPNFGKDVQFDTYFSDRLVQPPTRFGIFCLQLVDFLCKRYDGFWHFDWIPCIENHNSYQEMWTATIESLAFVVQQDCCVQIFQKYNLNYLLYCVCFRNIFF